MHKMIPNSLHITRGKMNVETLNETMLGLNVSKLLMITRWKGNPGKIEFYEIADSNLKLIPPILYLKKIILSRELGRAKGRGRNLKLGVVAPQNEKYTRLAEALSKILTIPLIEKNWSFPVVLNIVEDKIGQPRITFHNEKSEEVGPAIYLKEIRWDAENLKGM
ncbi:MAG: hypothetical protein QXH91_08900 [Candidatus Bathyarchaeia archaeon]